MMDALCIEDLHKRFGTNAVISGVSFSVARGSIFGFIGQNGAGKTTTMKMILGLLKPDRGSITVCGEPVSFGSTKTNRHIGFLPDVPEFYNYLYPREYLRLCGQIAGLDGHQIKTRTNELLDLVGLAGQNKRIGSFSRGMKQRLGVAQALINEPKLLICDEPTSALDPVGRKEILDILSRIKGHTTVIFSTHILSDVERICDQAALLHKGKIARSGTLAELKAQRKTNDVIVGFATTDERQRFASEPEIVALAKEQTGQLLPTEISLAGYNRSETELTILRILWQNKILPVKLEVVEPTIESLFLEVVQ